MTSADELTRRIVEYGTLRFGAGNAFSEKDLPGAMQLDREAEALLPAILSLASSMAAPTEQRYFDTLVWALGAGDDFPPREQGQAPYWWRKELQARAGLEWDGEKFVAVPAVPSDPKIEATK